MTLNACVKQVVVKEVGLGEATQTLTVTLEMPAYLALTHLIGSSVVANEIQVTHRPKAVPQPPPPPAR